MNLSESVEKIEKIFPGRPPDILKTLPIIGCCSEHAAGFEWYRDHEWKDLRHQIRENAPDYNKGLDPIEFGSLDPIAYHYFFPGVLTGIGDIIKNHQPSPDSYYHPDLDFCLLWLTGASPRKDSRETFRREHLSLFTKEERLAVKNFLQIFTAYLEDGWEDTKRVKEALQEVWN